LCVDGSFLVVAIHHEHLDGFAYSSKRDAFNKMRPDELKQLVVDKKALVCKMQAGSMIHIPVGMVVRQAAISTAVVLKWAVHDTSVEETKKVLSCAMLYCSSFPDLAQGAFSGWMKVLQDAVAKSA
jgi:hypothetical protein